MVSKKDNLSSDLEPDLRQPIGVMEWVETVRRLSGKSMRRFAEACGVCHSTLIRQANGQAPATERWMKVLCKMRRETGLTGNQMFKLWDKEYLDDEPKP